LRCGQERKKKKKKIRKKDMEGQTDDQKRHGKRERLRGKRIIGAVRGNDTVLNFAATGKKKITYSLSQNLKSFSRGRGNFIAEKQTQRK